MDRNSDATSPIEIEPRRWADIVLGVKDQIGADHVGLIAAGVAFYALLAIFPAMTALMALAGLILTPADVANQLQAVTALIPPAASQIILDQAVGVTGSARSGLGFAFGFGLVLAIYSASKGMGSLVEGLNVINGVEEGRGFFRKTLITLALTLFLIVGMVAGLLATLVVPAALHLIDLPDGIKMVLGLSRWIILALLAVFGLAVIYQFGPARPAAKLRWLTPGAVAACLIWIAASVGFTVYVTNFGSYNQSFGSMAGVVVLLLWLWISAFIVLLGAELNAALEANRPVEG